MANIQTKDKRVDTRRYAHELTPFIRQDLDNIRNLIKEETGFDILNRCRKREFVDARRVFAAVVYEKYGLTDGKECNGNSYLYQNLLTVTLLCKYLGYRQHSSILHLRRNFEDYCEQDPQLDYLYSKVTLAANSDIDARLNSLQKQRRIYLEKLQVINIDIQKINGFKYKINLQKRESTKRKAEEVNDNSITV
jgi:hypothetical protein